jgi:hypothetical protein
VDDVKSALPLCPGRETRYNGVDSRLPPRKRELIPKLHLSSDWGLQLDPMKLESLVTAHQPWCGEYVLEPCTHRPSNKPSWK